MPELTNPSGNEIRPDIAENQKIQEKFSTSPRIKGCLSPNVKVPDAAPIPPTRRVSRFVSGFSMRRWRRRLPNDKIGDGP